MVLVLKERVPEEKREELINRLRESFDNILNSPFEKGLYRLEEVKEFLGKLDKEVFILADENLHGLAYRKAIPPDIEPKFKWVVRLLKMLVEISEAEKDLGLYGCYEYDELKSAVVRLLGEGLIGLGKAVKKHGKRYYRDKSYCPEGISELFARIIFEYLKI